jgi:hypothetical protein
MDAVHGWRDDLQPGGAPRPMSRALAGLLAALCLGAAAPASSLAAHSVRIGIADDGIQRADPGTAAATVARWQELGIQVARLHVRWVTIAPAPGARRSPKRFHASDPDDPHYNWGALDRAIGLLRAAGIEPLLSVTGSGPLWSSTQPQLGNPRWRPSPYRFAQFATAVARRYRGEVSEYIVWNEPNQAGWLQPQFTCARVCTPESPNVYRHLFTAAAAAIRAADPGAQVYAGALAPRGSDPRSRNSAMRPLTFLRAFGCVDDRYRRIRRGHCAGFHAPLVDGISYHPHGVLRSPSQRNPQRDEAALADLGRLETVIDRVAAHGGLACTCAGRIPIHLTEFGYQTNPPDRYQGVSLARQARWLQEAGYRAWRDPRVKTLVQYEWRDDPLIVKGPGARAYGGWQSGLLFADGRPKPVLAAFPVPLWVTARPGFAAVSLWGQVRPGDAHLVSLQRRLPGRAWRTLGTIQTDVYGVFTAQLVLPAIARLRFGYDDGEQMTYSQPVTVRRSVGVVPPRGR